MCIELHPHAARCDRTRAAEKYRDGKSTSAMIGTKISPIYKYSDKAAEPPAKRSVRFAPANSIVF